MRIAQIAPLLESVPPRAYGGTERVVSYLSEALVALGHQITLYASGDSRTRGRLIPVVPVSLREQGRAGDWPIWTTLMLDQVFEDAAGGAFDVIHFHSDLLHYPLARRCDHTPCVTTLHGRQDIPGLANLCERFSGLPLVSISNSQREPLLGANWCATVYHGLPAELYHFHPKADNYFSFIGRISPEKRVDRAIEIAIGCGVPLRIAAKVDAADQVYFEQRIRPLLSHRLIDFVGEIGEAQKNDFIGNSRALLFPIDWPEPFGLVTIEALACGTPVISYDCGSVREVLRDGFDSFIVHDQKQAIGAGRHIDRIARANCRASFERRFTAADMARSYLEVYARLKPPDGTIDSEHCHASRQDSHRQQVVRRRHFRAQRAQPAGPEE